MKNVYQKLLHQQYKFSLFSNLRSFFQPGRTENFTNFASLDPLQLIHEPAIRERAVSFSLRYGAHIHTNCLSLEYQSVQRNIEKMLADHLGFEEVLLFDADSSCLFNIHKVLTQPANYVASSSGYPFTSEVPKSMTFKTKELFPLQESLQKLINSKNLPKILFAETLSPFDGTRENIDDLSKIAEESDSLLVVSDRYAFGVDGIDGFGLGAKKTKIDVLWGHFYKTYTPYASFLATSGEIKRYLLSSCPKLQIARPSPLALGAIAASIELFPEKNFERGQLAGLAEKMRKQLSPFFSFSTEDSCYPFLTLKFTDRDLAGFFQRSLTEEGFLLPPIESIDNVHLCKLRFNRNHTPDVIDEIARQACSLLPNANYPNPLDIFTKS